MNQKTERAQFVLGTLKNVTSAASKEIFSSRSPSHSVSDDEVSPESGAPRISKRRRKSWKEDLPVIFDNIMTHVDVDDKDLLACLSLFESADSDENDSKKRRKSGQVDVSDEVFGTNVALVDDEDCSCGSFILDDCSLHLFSMEGSQQGEQSSILPPGTSGLARHREVMPSDRSYIDLSFSSDTDSNRVDNGEDDISINADVLSELVGGDLCDPISKKESMEVTNHEKGFLNATSNNKTVAEPLTAKTTVREKNVESILGIKLPPKDTKKTSFRTSPHQAPYTYDHYLTSNSADNGALKFLNESHSTGPNSTKMNTKLLTISQPTSESIRNKEDHAVQAVAKITTTANLITVADRNNKDRSVGSRSLSIGSVNSNSKSSSRSKTTLSKNCANTNHQLVANGCKPFSAILPKVSQTPPQGSADRSRIMLTPLDVLLGRGKRFNINPGNERFRMLVNEKKPLYFQQSTKKKKNDISIHVMKSVHAYGGRFLEITCNDPLTYQVVSDHRARKKCSQRLRDG